MPATVTQLDESELSAWRGMLRAHRDIVARLDRELVSAHDLPLGSYEVLMYLGDAPDGKLRMGELAGKLLLSRSGLTRLVDRLERASLVGRERCDDDGRGWFALITPKGRRALATARPTHLDGVRQHFLDQLSASELKTLGTVFDRLNADR